MEVHSVSAAAEFLGQDAEDIPRVRLALGAYIEETEAALAGGSLNRVRRGAYVLGLAKAKLWLPVVEIAAGLGEIERRVGADGCSVTERASRSLELRRHEEAIARLEASDERELLAVQAGALREAMASADKLRAETPLNAAPVGKESVVEPEKLSRPDSAPRREEPLRFVSATEVRVRAGEAFSHKLSTEPAADRFDVVRLPAEWVFDVASGSVSGRPSALGVYVLEIGAWKSGVRTPTRVTVVVEPAAELPEIVVPAELYAIVGQFVRCDIGGVPEEAEVIVAGMPAGLSFDVAGRCLQGTPRQIGTSAISFVVRSLGGEASGKMKLVVRSAKPRLILPALGALFVGQEFSAKIEVENGPAQMHVHGLPAGVSFDGAGGLSGAPVDAGLYSADVSAVNDGGQDRRRLVFDVQALVPKIEPAVAFTLQHADKRRLIVSAAPVFRLGRTGESSYAVCVCAKRNPAASKTLSLEISRQHAEIFWTDNALMVRDGWSPEGKPSMLGTFLDAEKVGTQGVSIRNQQILRLTRRDPGEAVAHWRVTLLMVGDIAGKISPGLRPDFHGRVAAAWLQRLDNVPEDILLMPMAADLNAIGRSRAPVCMARVGEGFLAASGNGAPVPIAAVPALAAELLVLSPDQMVQLSLREVLELSLKG